jgi:hypothetical protein
MAPHVDEEEPLWSAAALAAEACGFDRESGAFVSDDGWEVTSAARRGCRRAIMFGPASCGTVDAGVVSSATLRGVVELVSRGSYPLTFGLSAFVPDVPASGARLIGDVESLS